MGRSATPILKRSKMRLDLLLCERGLTESRTEAKNFITAGAVSVAGVTVKKPSYDVSPDITDIIIDKSSKKYASRAGLKLEWALDKFGINAEGKRALDVGASSGGFTDCLLAHGAKQVIAVDSGYGQLVPALRSDPRVIVKENYNARYMTADDLEYTPDICVMDVSFISATYIIPAVADVIDPFGEFICLIKPQFEVGKSALGKGGIVKDEKQRKTAIDKVVFSARNSGFVFLGLTESPIQGGDGNIEYLAYFRKGNEFSEKNYIDSESEKR